MIDRAQSVYQSGRAHHDGAVQADQEIQDASFAWFEDARASHARRNTAGFHAFDGRPQPVEVQVVERDAGGRERCSCQRQRRFELLGRAHQHVEFGRVCWLRGLQRKLELADSRRRIVNLGNRGACLDGM